jgi:CheY-like chemotaxis protein
MDRMSDATSTAALAKRRVLLVEDDYFIVSDLARSFEAEGAEVVGPAATVADGLALLAEAPNLDGAVLDINLQGEMVFPLADALTARGVPFVFATGSTGRWCRRATLRSPIARSRSSRGRSPASCSGPERRRRRLEHRP